MSNDDLRAEEIDVEERETLADKLRTDFCTDVLAGCYDCDCTKCQERKARPRYNPNQITMKV